MEDRLFPLKKGSFWRGRVTDTEISEVGMRCTHNAIATVIPALSGPRLSAYCSYCVKINPSTCGSLSWVLQGANFVFSVLISIMTIYNLGGSRWVKKPENDRKLLISMSLILKQSLLTVSHCHCVCLCEARGYLQSFLVLSVLRMRLK